MPGSHSTPGCVHRRLADEHRLTEFLPKNRLDRLRAKKCPKHTVKSTLRLLIPVTMFAAATPSVGHAQTSAVLTLEQSTNALTGWQTIRTIATSGPFSPQAFYRMRIVMTNNSPTNMARIAAGSFSMGNAHSAVGDGYPWELPVHTVDVSAFYIDKYEVTKTLWDEVANWAAANGYDIAAPSAAGGADNRPVHDVTWYEAVKWCNARSEKEGLMPCYTVGGAVMRTGESNPDCDFAVNGYRLPTEAEWEKAARGGLSNLRFPWGDTITHSEANYRSSSSYSYDVSPTRDLHPVYAGSSPVGSFAPNGYGLCDTVGNMWEWTWDWAGDYTSSPSTDPQGPSTGIARRIRGGSWNDFAVNSRTSSRANEYPDTSKSFIGFRCARTPVP